VTHPTDDAHATDEAHSSEAERLRRASQPIHRVTTLHDVRIPVSDGLELSANLWLPEPAVDGTGPRRFPAILEMIPYRKDDWRAASDESRGEWLAARGFALCRLDIRGTGSSPGIALDEYTARETRDGYDAVEWLARQPWSTGKVGMWGISYGGFTAIQVALLHPPHLAAIVPMMATDDRYTDDVHYLGGCVTVSELSQYAVSMVGMNALPANREYRGAAWLDEWRDRLEGTPVWLYEWLRQQHDGPYWRQGSLAPHWDRLTTPTFLIGGWMDEYVDAALRMLERCTNAPRRALIGNWVHDLPHDAYPGPNLDWYHEMIRFFDHWLKGVDNGVMDEPALVAFRHEWAGPEPFPAAWPGAWIAEERWPPADLDESILYLASGEQPLVGNLTVEAAPGPRIVERFRHRPTVGTRAGLSWGAGGQPNGLARDLRPDDALCPAFTSEPLAADLDVVGVASVVLQWESPVPVATAVVRLQDVAPDGTPFQVSAGILNLTHRSSHAAPEPLEPGVVTEVRIQLRATAHRFLAGHRIRLSLASAMWPVVWPSPFVAVFGLHLGGDPAAASRLVLPIVPAGHVGADVPAFKTTPAALRDIGSYRGDPPVWQVIEDVIEGSLTVVTSEFGEATLPDGRTTLYTGERLEMTARDADPADARMHNEVVYRLRADDTEILIEADGTIQTSATDFHMDVGLRVSLDGVPFFERDWAETIPRRLV
jgi:putative CocE/NonD family hydrolase